MSAFKSELLLRDLGDGAHFALIGPLLYQSDRLHDNVFVPSGFITDFASVPQLFWMILPKVGPWDKAAVLHDFLYLEGGVTRGEADGVFDEAMGVLGIARWKRRVMYLSVRVGGWKPWRRYRAAEAV